MKRTITVSLTLALILVSGFVPIAAAKSVNGDQLNSPTLANDKQDRCKTEKGEPCNPPR